FSQNRTVERAGGRVPIRLPRRRCYCCCASLGWLARLDGAELSSPPSRAHRSTSPENLAASPQHVLAGESRTLRYCLAPCCLTSTLEGSRGSGGHESRQRSGGGEPKGRRRYDRQRPAHAIPGRPPRCAGYATQDVRDDGSRSSVCRRPCGGRVGGHRRPVQDLGAWAGVRGDHGGREARHASLELAACGRAIPGLGGDRGNRKGGRGRGQRSLGGGGGGDAIGNHRQRQRRQVETRDGSAHGDSSGGGGSGGGGGDDDKGRAKDSHWRIATVVKSYLQIETARPHHLYCPSNVRPFEYAEGSFREKTWTLGYRRSATMISVWPRRMRMFLIDRGGRTKSTGNK
ncbi:unnamed protein product, partial [Ectocarpus sp. 12 AP-2014]